MLAHEQVLKNSMRIGYQTLSIFLKGVHAVTQDYNALPSPNRIVSDTGASLDWFTELGVENKWKIRRIILGPGKNFLVALHPDVIRAVFKSRKPHPF